MTVELDDVDEALYGCARDFAVEILGEPVRITRYTNHPPRMFEGWAVVWHGEYYLGTEGYYDYKSAVTFTTARIALGAAQAGRRPGTGRPVVDNTNRKDLQP